MLSVNFTYVAIPVALLSLAAPAGAQPKPTMNQYVVQAAEMLARDRRLGGYNLQRRFTRDLNYGGDCCLRATPPLSASHPNPTMCVAAMIEVMVEALNLYERATGDTSFRTKLPLSRWNNGNKTGVIPNVFMYAGTNSAGTAATFKKLGLGEERPFQDLRAGDFVNLNRASGSGHAVVFLGYLKAGSSAPTPQFSSEVVGFKYFSAQGKGRPDGGFGYRNAYFVGHCPTPRGRNDDCNIVGVRVKPNGTVQQSRILFNTGTMFTPAAWRTEAALQDLVKQVTRSFEEEGLTRDSGLDAAVQADLAKQLSPDETKFEDGTEDGL